MGWTQDRSEFRIGTLLGMKPTKCCFQCGEGTETFQIWHLGSSNWRVWDRGVFMSGQTFIYEVSQELVFLQRGEHFIKGIPDVNTT